MTRSPFPTPPHFDPASIERIRRVRYAELSQAAETWRNRYGIRPAVDDDHRICLLAVDVQITFCLPDSELFVAGRSGRGGIDDARRLCEFIYRNLGSITRVFPTMDTHSAFQIFHPGFLQTADGRPPEPQQIISVEDVEKGRIQARPEVCTELGLDPGQVNRHLLYYAEQLAGNSKYEWMVWPYHALLGGIGHALVPAFEEAVFFHSMVRSSPPGIHLKGSNTLTEHYSVFGAEVDRDADGKAIASHNTDLLSQLAEFDQILVAGQAQSHCVAWTLQDIVDKPAAQRFELAKKVLILEDCMSPVVIPDVVDFTESTKRLFDRLEKAGMRRIRSTDPLPERETARK